MKFRNKIDCFKINRLCLPLLAACMSMPLLLATGLSAKDATITDFLNRTAKVKATYTWMGSDFHENPEKVVRDLHENGFNTLFIKNVQFDNQKEDEWRKRWLNAADRNKICVFACLNYYSAGPEFKNAAKYRQAVDDKGKTLTVPCPVNRQYWMEVILPRAKDLAKLFGQHSSLSGILFDTEMYGHNPLHYSNACCFCDSCFNTFLRMYDCTSQIVRGERLQWLKQEKLLESYRSYLKSQISLIAVDFQKQCRMVAPKLLFGFMNYSDNWFFSGLMDGFNDPALPIIVAPEDTYEHGFFPEVLYRYRKLKNKYNLLYVSGIWNTCFKPDRLAVVTYRLANNVDGYFDYTCFSFYPEGHAKERARIKEYSNGDLNAYWRAYCLVNSEIDKKVTNPSYSSCLEQDQQNLLVQKKLLESLPKLKPEEMKILFKTLTSLRGAEGVVFPVSPQNSEISFIFDLEKLEKLRSVSITASGGGTKNGCFLPEELNVMGSTDRKDWFLLGVVGRNEKTLSFPENGWHSEKHYIKEMTVNIKDDRKVRYLNLTIRKPSDSYAAKVTKIKSNQVKFLKLLNIAAYK